MNRFVKIALAFSLVINVFFSLRYFQGKPDIDFYGGSRADAYLIKKHLAGDSYLIEHRNSNDKRLHVYTAKCQGAVTWEKGIVNPSASMGDACIYLPDLVGKTIVAGKMRKEDNIIVYVPWANDDTVQTADVLSIVRDDTANLAF